MKLLVELPIGFGSCFLGKGNKNTIRDDSGMLDNKKTVNLEESYWRTKYAEVFPKHERFCEKLESLIKEILHNNEIEYFTIVSRPKEEERFIKKVYSTTYTFVNPIEEMVDLSGIRIVLFSIDDVEKVSSLINENFNINEHRSFDKRSKMQPNEVGYLSIHKCITLKEDRTQLTEWSNFIDLQAEIQIRTILQHSWADISHKLDYKNEDEIPNILRRQIYLLAGLLEIADGKLSEILNQLNELNQEIQFQLESGTDPIPIDVIKIKQYLIASNTIKTLKSKLLESDLRIQDDNNIQCIIDISKKLNLNDIRELEDEFQAVLPIIDDIITNLKYDLEVTGARMNLLLCFPLIIRHLEVFTDEDLLGYFYSNEIVERFDKIREKQKISS